MATNYPIDVSLAVYKKLTSLLEEGQSYDDVLRVLLGADSPTEIRDFEIDIEENIPSFSWRAALGRSNGFVSRLLFLPNGTKLRARYKNSDYHAAIVSNKWLDSDGNSQTSPSAAAKMITGTNVNGLRFWEAQLPDQLGWRRLESLIK
jgi:hypothetical protein